MHQYPSAHEKALSKKFFGKIILGMQCNKKEAPVPHLMDIHVPHRVIQSLRQFSGAHLDEGGLPYSLSRTPPRLRIKPQDIVRSLSMHTANNFDAENHQHIRCLIANSKVYFTGGSEQ